jgi:hypothetical protein
VNLNGLDLTLGETPDGPTGRMPVLPRQRFDTLLPIASPQ